MLDNQGRSTLGLHAAGARFMSRAGRRGAVRRTFVGMQEARFWPGRASSREINETASDETADS